MHILLIPDVDYGRVRRSVKHNVQKKSKKTRTDRASIARYMLVRRRCFSAWRSIASAINRCEPVSQNKKK